jgi:REP element-mobilizing transposase RayT
VYNRTARELPALGDESDARYFLELLGEIAARDGWTVFAYCLMSNHYHLVLRSGPPPIARGMGHLQARFSQRHNRSGRGSGPLWQGRYKAKLIDDEAYLYQVIAYVHLNPVAAGLADDPASWPWSGHRELIGASDHRIVAATTVLSLYGATRAAARRSYVASLRSGRTGPWIGEQPGRLPWWPAAPDRQLDAPVPPAIVDERGTSTAISRPRLAPEVFLKLACDTLGVSADDLATASRSRDLSRIRQLVVGLGVERWSQSTKSLAGLLNRRADSGSEWVHRCIELRQTRPSFGAAYLRLDEALSAAARLLVPE